MTEAKHTPGPWVAEIEPASDWGPAYFKRVVDGNGQTIRVHGVSLSSGAEAEANGRLIAAVPDLLAVVRDACAIFDRNRDGDEYNGDLASDLWKDDIHEKLTAALVKALLA